jgi:mono/diheme cytochrome c family protein
MQIPSIFSVVGLVISLTIFGAPQQKEIKNIPIKPISATNGPEMYKAYCAVCHGIDGKGHGPAAEVLKVPPPDLTTLAKMNGGKYPFDHVTSTIRGEVRLPAHGSKEMPVWGVPFWSLSQGHSSEVQLRVTNLSKYIESLQEK